MTVPLYWVGLLLVVGLAGAICPSPTLWGKDADCIDHGVIEFAGQELGAAQCGDVVIFSDATWMNVPDGYVLINLGNAFYFYAPSLDAIMDLNPVDRVPLAESSP